MNLTDLQREAHAIAKARGWWPPKCPDCGHVASWIEGDDRVHPHIRGTWWCDDAGVEVESPFGGPITERSFGDLIGDVHEPLSGARKAYRRHGDMGPRRLMASGELEPGHYFQQLDTGGDYLKRYKPIGVPSELADVVIRVADMAEFYGWNLDAPADSIKQIFQQEPSRLNGLDIFGTWLTKCHAELSMAFSMMELDDDYHREAVGWVMAKLVVMIQRMATHYGIDLDAAVEAKLAYMRAGK